MITAQVRLRIMTLIAKQLHSLFPQILRSHMMHQTVQI